MEQWNEVLDQIKQKIGRPSFETWLKNTSAELSDDELIVKTQNEFQADWLEERYLTLISETVENVMEKNMKIVFSYPDGTDLRRQPSTNRSNNSAYEELRDQLIEHQEKIKHLEQRVNLLEGVTTKFVYINDTNRKVIIHPATETHGTKCDMAPIQPLEQRVFYLPKDTNPWVKMWDHGEKGGLVILVSSIKKDN
ncbi:DnaA N-terminal domain-containing protein [Bacillus marasmi]|uniref:DnaA N-terminal domain-containing protein n=1 Tax=Bacillus marasmi TaxID=1926279 RepID=UPI0011CA9C75|nr:DnaA N-terminal domain-containing protein [Bacillus marasmi]